MPVLEKRDLQIYLHSSKSASLPANASYREEITLVLEKRENFGIWSLGRGLWHNSAVPL